MVFFGETQGARVILRNNLTLTRLNDLHQSGLGLELSFFYEVARRLTNLPRTENFCGVNLFSTSCSNLRGLEFQGEEFKINNLQTAEDNFQDSPSREAKIGLTETIKTLRRG
ncbi:hypothetical protein LOAG_15979 [Loa loa]|uniref:Uncharacterized protein n=1 Tax=Loa loa TaxID=7209 RepID=A0A1S0TF95_LOALO|nr:hypothetical protein LOAG_15979 [Loa loa]EFO12552.1 hypothetical protein LOAG_15979 [Loa loa]